MDTPLRTLEGDIAQLEYAAEMVKEEVVRNKDRLASSQYQILMKRITSLEEAAVTLAKKHNSAVYFGINAATQKMAFYLEGMEPNLGKARNMEPFLEEGASSTAASSKPMGVTEDEPMSDEDDDDKPKFEDPDADLINAILEQTGTKRKAKTNETGDNDDDDDDDEEDGFDELLADEDEEEDEEEDAED